MEDNKKASKTASFYIHFPFCLKKCPYCDFNSHVKQDEYDFSTYLQAYESEIAYYASLLPNITITSIFFGGGTPSPMPIFLVEGILGAISKNFSLTSNIEISLEANPTSFEAEQFKDFKKAGINRASLGVQSFEDASLKFLGREHSAKEAIEAITEAINIFDNFSFDLIYALPNQTINDWQKQLKRAISFNTPHLSLYQLTIERGTEFFRLFNKGELPNLPNEEEKAEFYHATEEITYSAGLYAYEVSNYAKPNYECKHNLNYWQFGDYIGIGAGAIGRISGNASSNKVLAKKETIHTHSPQKWLLQALSEGRGLQEEVALSQNDMLREILMFGLRIKEGISLALFKKYFDANYSHILGEKKLNSLINEGLIEITNTNLKTTQKGRMLINSVVKFLAG